MYVCRAYKSDFIAGKFFIWCFKSDFYCASNLAKLVPFINNANLLTKRYDHRVSDSVSSPRELDSSKSLMYCNFSY